MLNHSTTNQGSCGYNIFAPATTGSDQVVGFGAGDTRNLAKHFANVAALLSATAFSGGNSTIHLDATGDVLTLTGVSQSQFTTFANAGEIKFH